MALNPVQSVQSNITPQEKKQVGTGFTNINRILDANKQNRLGSSIVGNIKQQAGGIKQGIGQQASQFKQQANANLIDTEANKNLRSSTLNNIVGTNPTAGQPNSTMNDSLGDGKSQPISGNAGVIDRGDIGTRGQENMTQTTQSGFKDPDADTIKAFQEMQSGVYKGPTGLDEQKTALLKRQGQDIGQLGQLTGTNAGRQTLLQRIVGNPNYTAGQQKMDTLLLGQSGKDLNQVRRETQGLTDQLGVEQQRATNLAQEYQKRNEQFGKETTGLVSGALTGQTEAQKAAYDKTIADAQAQLSGLYKGLDDVDSSTDMSKRTLLTPKQFKELGIDPSTEEGMKKAKVMNGLFALSNREFANYVRLMWINGENGERPGHWSTPDADGQSQYYEDPLVRKWFDVNKGSGLFSDYKQGQQLTDEMKKRIGIGGNIRVAQIDKSNSKNVDWGDYLSSDVLSRTKDEKGNFVYNPLKTMTELSNADQLRRINALRQLGTDRTAPLYTQDEISNAGKVNLNPIFDYNRAKQQVQDVTVSPDDEISFKDDNGHSELAKYVQSQGAHWGQQVGKHPAATAGGVTGGMAGGTVGSVLFPGVGTYAGGTIGATAGAELGNLLDNSFIGDIYTPLTEQIGTDIGTGVGEVAGGLTDLGVDLYEEVESWFCFLPGSMVKMIDRSFKKIEDIMPKEEIFGGGRVLIVGKAYSGEIYDHDNVKVSGSHSTFEDDSWKNVRQSHLAKKLDNITEDVIVYNMVTENHIIVVDNKIYTDFVEFSGADLCTPEERLTVLNSDKEFVRSISKELKNESKSSEI